MIAESQLTNNGLLQTAPKRLANDSSTLSAGWAGSFKRFINQCLDDLFSRLPVGYEDENGFHFGAYPDLGLADPFLADGGAQANEFEFCRVPADAAGSR